MNDGECVSCFSLGEIGWPSLILYIMFFHFLRSLWFHLSLRLKSNLIGIVIYFNTILIIHSSIDGHLDMLISFKRTTVVPFIFNWQWCHQSQRTNCSSGQSHQILFWDFSFSSLSLQLILHCIMKPIFLEKKNDWIFHSSLNSPLSTNVKILSADVGCSTLLLGILFSSSTSYEQYPKGSSIGELSTLM